MNSIAGKELTCFRHGATADEGWFLDETSSALRASTPSIVFLPRRDRKRSAIDVAMELSGAGVDPIVTSTYSSWSESSCWLTSIRYAPSGRPYAALLHLQVYSVARSLVVAPSIEVATQSELGELPKIEIVLGGPLRRIVASCNPSNADLADEFSRNLKDLQKEIDEALSATTAQQCAHVLVDDERREPGGGNRFKGIERISSLHMALHSLEAFVYASRSEDRSTERISALRSMCSDAMTSASSHLAARALEAAEKRSAIDSERAEREGIWAQRLTAAGTGIAVASLWPSVWSGTVDPKLGRLAPSILLCTTALVAASSAFAVAFLIGSKGRSRTTQILVPLLSSFLIAFSLVVHLLLMAPAKDLKWIASLLKT